MTFDPAPTVPDDHHASHHDYAPALQEPTASRAIDSSLPPYTAPAACSGVADRNLLENLDDDAWDSSRHPPVLIDNLAIAIDDLDWAFATATYQMSNRTCEGATFLRLAHDVFLVVVRGGQFLHADRHLTDIDGGGFSEHCWNYVIDANDQQLVVEVDTGVFEHFPLTPQAFVYFNSMNRHLVTRKCPHALCIIAQVDGYAGDQPALAAARLRYVLATRPKAKAV